MNMYLKSVVCGANIPLLHRKKDQTVPVICLSLLCPTLLGWWWVEIIKGVWPQQHALGEGYLPCMEMVTVNLHVCVVLVWWKRLHAPVEGNCPVQLNLLLGPSSNKPGRVGHSSDRCITVKLEIQIQGLFFLDTQIRTNCLMCFYV